MSGSQARQKNWRMKIHLLEFERFSRSAMKDLRSLGEVTTGPQTEESKEASVLFVRLARKIDRDFLQTYFPRIQYVLSPTTGHDHLDTAYFDEKGIRLISLKGETSFLSNIPSTAEHTWALLLALMRKLPSAASHALAEKWDRDRFIGNNLFGKKIGILGMGRVGTQVAGFARAFGMEIHAYDIRPLKYPGDITVHLNFESLAGAIDILSIHIPMDESNRNWLDKRRISQLKSGIKLINTSRGGVWDENFLASQVRNGAISGIASDVLDYELQPELLLSSPLIACAKDGFPVIITPHIAGACIESMHGTEEFVVQKLLKVLNG